MHVHLSFESCLKMTILCQEMTLEEYEKVLEEKRKALQALKTTEERKVDAKEFESMQQLSNKKGNDDIFIKLVCIFTSFVFRFVGYL